MSFREIIGQEISLSILENSLKADRIAHAYLFIGEEGVGKSLTARNLAKILNCEGNSIDACDQCLSCRKIDRFIHPEVRWFKPDGISQTIKIEHILELQREISLRPAEGRKKIFIFLEAERMNREAANAFLKTLEEPPGESVLILISSFPERLLPTVKSRCQVIRFSLIPQPIIERFLRENLGCSEEEAKFLSLVSEGRLGQAVRLKEERDGKKGGAVLDLILEKDKNILDVVDRMTDIWGKEADDFQTRHSQEWEARSEGLDKRNKKVFDEQKKAVLEREYRRNIDRDIESILSFFRDCLVWKITEDQKFIMNQKHFSLIKSMTGSLNREDLKLKIEAIKDIKNAISRNAHLRLALTVMMVELFNGL